MPVEKPAKRPRGRPHEWLAAHLDKMGRGAKSRLALALGRPPERVSEIFSGVWKVKAREAICIAQFTGLPLDLVYDKFDLPLPPIESVAPLVGYVGAGDEIINLGTDRDAREFIGAPERLVNGAAVVVRGDSMLPAYRNGDILFFEMKPDSSRSDEALRRAFGRDCIVQVDGGLLFLKVLRKGSRAGRFHLLSYNRPEVIADQRIDWASPVLWVKRA